MKNEPVSHKLSPIGELSQVEQGVVVKQEQPMTVDVALPPVVPSHSVGVQDSSEVVVDPSAAVEESSPVPHYSKFVLSIP